MPLGEDASTAWEPVRYLPDFASLFQPGPRASSGKRSTGRNLAPAQAKVALPPVRQ